MIIEIYPVTFKRLLEGLSSQFLKQKRAKCKSGDFGVQMSAEAKKFFSVVVRESKSNFLISFILGIYPGRL